MITNVASVPPADKTACIKKYHILMQQRFSNIIFAKAQIFDELNKRWFGNSVVEIGKTVSIHLMSNHLKYNFSKK